MKFNATFALIVICGLAAYSQALPTKRLTVYQQPAAGRHYSAPQRMMFMRYVQPYNSYGHAAHSHQAAASLAGGNSGSASTYLQDSSSDGVYAASTQEESIAAAANGHSVAEAYPAAPANAGGVSFGVADSLGAATSAEEERKVTVEVDLDPVSIHEVGSEHDAKEAREYNYDAAVAGSNAAGVGVVGAGAGVNGGFATGDVASEVKTSDASSAEAGGTKVIVDLSGADDTEVPIAPVAPGQSLAAKKKVIVELEQAAEADSDNAIAAQNDDDQQIQNDSEDDEAYVPVPVAPKVPGRRRPVVKKPYAPKPQPVGTFFPVDFGSATDGSIAIANSFSTGENGSATSHAISYGNPSTARNHLRPSRRH